MARQSRAPTLLLTRPAPQSQRFAQEVRALHPTVQVVISPLMQTKWLTPVLPDGPVRALILTSETGAEAAGQLRLSGHALPDLAYCVGPRTADAARAAGFQPLSAEGDVHALESLIRAAKAEGPLLHIRGQDAAGNLAQSLTMGGIVTYSAITYAQEPCPLTPAATAVLQGEGPILLPLFSPRSAQIFAQSMPPNTTAPLWIVAISPAAALQAQPLNPARLITAAQPNGGNMLHAVADLLASAASA
jgi:uroporphyrinogen-III synthase